MLSKDENVVYIGRKPVMSYVLAVLTHLSGTNAKEVVLKARGMAISTAVDTAEITRRRFMDKKLEISNISINTEEILEQETNQTRAVSTIEITLSTIIEKEPKPLPKKKLKSGEEKT